VAAGVIAPGASTVLFSRAVQHSGPSRTSIVVGASPLAAAVIAIALLGETADPVILAGGLLIVLGGFALLGERQRPELFRSIGIAFAIAALVLVAVRDNLIRAHSDDTPVQASLGAAVTLATSTTAILLFLLVTRRGRLGVGAQQVKSFAAAGVLFGLSLILLFEAYYRGPVTVVSPLIATESIWGVGFAVLLFRRTELVGLRLVIGALLVVAGGAIIGARQ
jgi:bacterial/archaeal transporter family protein